MTQLYNIQNGGGVLCLVSGHGVQFLSNGKSSMKCGASITDRHTHAPNLIMHQQPMVALFISNRSTTAPKWPGC